MKGLFRVLMVAAIYVVVSLSAWAQFSGNVQGSVQDSSGAAVPGADMTLTKLDTNVVHTTKSEEDGSYRFVSLAPGRYQVLVKASGFAPATVEVTLLTDQTVNVPMVLKVGSVTESVVVTTEAPLLNTADSRTEMTVQSQELTNLPLQGRNLLALSTVAPGVTGLGLAPGGSPGSAADNYSTETQVDASANGRGSVGNMYIVDGVDVTSDIRPGVLNLTPNPDSIQETSIQPNTFSVEYGRASSIQMIMTSKSGSNKFHGSASDYFTYQNLWALTERAQPRKFRALALGLVSPFELGVGARQTIVDLRAERSQAARCFQLLGGVGRISEFEPRATQQIVRGKGVGRKFHGLPGGTRSILIAIEP